MSNFTLQTEAVCRLLLHVCKFSHLPVCGLLVGRASGNNVEIVDSVPLFHGSEVNLSTMFEVALTQVDHECQQRGLVIAGCYSANERLRDQQVSLSASSLASKIRFAFPQCCLLLIDNTEISKDLTSSAPLKLCCFQNGRWVETDRASALQIAANSLETASALIKMKAVDRVMDFAEHLDDISVDWLLPDFASIRASE
eukprot:gnl/Hemi2/19063_TR6315_c0_g1_i1.p1 gnl/Hemi2/19063_TR6315_c0_g1~~gnl/Hemi2/19063_TR6315_c0_g1_i1.p1  ORF type:complete len:198 (+),score=17.94 gnl/Hemi2/19063_TR6315_c0_g1_i1:112-705(+)